MKNLELLDDTHTSWRSESSNIGLVILDMLLFRFQSPYPLGEVNQAIQGHIIPVDEELRINR